MTDTPKIRGGIAAASPRTRALEVLIQASLDQLLDEAPAKANEGLLFLGNWHDALPRLLIQDPILQPVDKVVWQVIKLQAAAQGATGFPTYDQIARWANVASDTTVSRAISILRSTRWLTLCVQKARTKKGRFRGNIYALHDEPLALGDTLHLDPEYMQFLCRLSAKPGEGRVGEVAKAVLGSIELDIQEGIDVTAPRDAMTERMEAMRFITAQPGQAGPPPARVFGVRRGFAMTLQSRVKDPDPAEIAETGEEDAGRSLDLFAPDIHLQILKMDENHHLQNLKVGNRLQNLKPATQPQNLSPQILGSPPDSCSGGSKNITTTTAYLDGLDNKSARAREGELENAGCVPGTQYDRSAESASVQGVPLGSDGPAPSTNGAIRLSQSSQPASRPNEGPAGNCVPGTQLPGEVNVSAVRYPAELSQNEILLAGIHLAPVPAALQQEVLDLLGDRIRAATAGIMEPLLYGPLGYLRTLCKAAVEGKLIRRTRSLQVVAIAKPASPPPPVDEVAVELKKLRDEHFNALQWKQKLERIGPGRSPTAEQLRQHQDRVDDAARQVSRLSRQIQEFLAQRPDLSPAAANSDKPPQPQAPGARQ